VERDKIRADLVVVDLEPTPVRTAEELGQAVSEAVEESVAAADLVAVPIVDRVAQAGLASAAADSVVTLGPETASRHPVVANSTAFWVCPLMEDCIARHQRALDGATSAWGAMRGSAAIDPAQVRMVGELVTISASGVAGLVWAQVASAVRGLALVEWADPVSVKAA